MQNIMQNGGTGAIYRHFSGYETGDETGVSFWVVYGGSPYYGNDDPGGLSFLSSFLMKSLMLSILIP